MVDHIFRRIKVNSLPIYTGTAISTTSLNDIASPRNNNTSTATTTDKSSSSTKNNVSAATKTSTEEDTTFQQQIIVEASMARSEMDRKLPSGKANDNSEEFLNDTANVFQEEHVESGSTAVAVEKPLPQPPQQPVDNDQQQQSNNGTEEPVETIASEKEGEESTTEVIEATMETNGTDGYEY